MILLTVKIRILPNPLKELRQTLDALRPRVRKKKGFLNASIYKDMEKHNVFYIIQQWKTQTDLDAYMSSENHKVLLGAIRLLSESPPIKMNSFVLTNETEV